MRKMNPKPICLWDLDGTLVDYHAQMSADLKLCLPPDLQHLTEEHSERLPWLKNICRMIKNQPGWWANLHAIEEGIQLFQTVAKMGFRNHVLTRGPAYATQAWGEKFGWCGQNLGRTPVTVTQDKGLVYGKVLVDDWPDYIEAWLKWRPRGTVIMPDQPWNKHFNHPQVVRAVYGDAAQMFRVHQALSDQLERETS